MSMIKKEVKIRMFVLIMSMLFVLFFSFNMGYAEENITIDFNTDKESYDVGDEVVFKGDFFINGVRVLSVPSTLEIVDPLGDTQDVEFQDHTDGTYKGSFEPTMEGSHRAVLTSEIAGDKRENELNFSVLSHGIDFELEMPDEFIYGFGPVDIEGDVSIERDSRPLDKNIRLMKKASGDDSFSDLCEFECDGNCSFSCTMGKNIKLTDYEILARTTYDGVEQIERSSFSIVMGATENLDVGLIHEKIYLDNETSDILINTTYEQEPLRDAKVNLKIETPGNETMDMVADEFNPGEYLVSYAPPESGDYNLEATVSKDDIYGIKRSNFTVIDSSRIIKPEVYEAICVDEGKKLRFAPFNTTKKSILSTKNLIDGKSNLSSAYLLSDNEKEKINATESLIDITSPGEKFFSVLLDESLANNFSVNFTRAKERVDYEIEGVADYFRFIPPEFEQKKIDFVYSNGAIINSWRQDVIYSRGNGSIYTQPTEAVINLSDVEHEKEILQEEIINFTPVYKNRFDKAEIKIYSSDGEKIVDEGFDDSFGFETTNETLPGEYLYIFTAYSNETAESIYGDFIVYSATPDVEILGRYNESVMRGTELEFEHEVKNNNYRDSDVINLDYNSSFVSVDFYKGDEKLNDSNNNGFIDTGKISPGESVEIKAKVRVPSDVVIGSEDELKITAISSQDMDKNSTAKNIISVVAFEEEKEPEYRDALEILSIENYQENIRVNIRNHHNESKIARLKAYVDSGEGRVQEGTFEYRIARDNIQGVIVPKKYPDEENFTATMKLVDEQGEKLEDEISENKNKTLYHYPGWHLDSFEKRIPVPLRETLGTFHDEFIVRVYLDFNGTPEHIVPVIQTGEGFRTGNYKEVVSDDKGGFFMLHFEDIPASSETYAYVYFGDEDTEIDYENSKFEYEKIITNSDAITTGRWVSDRQIGGFYGSDYLHDLDAEKGWKTVRYELDLPLDNYELYKNYPSDDRFASQVPLLINTNKSTDYIELNQRVDGDRWNYLGSYTFDNESYITIGNYGTRGIVVADSFRLEKVSFYSSALPVQNYRDEIIKEEPKLPVSRYELSVFNKTELNMSEFLTDLEQITYKTTKGIEIELINETALLKVNKSGEVNFTDQLEKVNFDITKTNETVPEEETLLIEEEEEKREWHRAIVNEPVRWNLSVSEEEEVKIPIEAKNLEIFNSTKKKVEPKFVFDGHEFERDGFDKLMQRQKLEEDLEYIREKEEEGLLARAASYLDERSIQREIDQLDVPDVDVGNRANVRLPDKEDSYEIMYETPAPMVNKGSEIEDGFQRRQGVTVYSNASVHYKNVLTTVNITPAKKEQINLYWEVNDTKVNVIDDDRFNVTFIDETGDGKIEKLQWVTPQLSEQNFEVVIDLTVLNVQSYPSLYHNWTVDFNTTGQANLTIMAVNDTTWAEFLNDSSDTVDDLEFMELYCGDESVKDDEFYVVLENETMVKYSEIEGDDNFRVEALKFLDWQCDGKTSRIQNRIITTGEHHLMFEFGNNTAYAHNYGFLLYEDFEDYHVDQEPDYWQDYNDAYEIVSDDDEQYYRGNASNSGEELVAEYGFEDAYNWSDYEVNTRMRIIQEDGAEPAHGVYLYSDYEEGNLIRIFSDGDEGNYTLTVEGFDMVGDLTSEVNPLESEWYELRAQVKEEYVDREWMTGYTTVVYAKIWESGTAEPEEWQIDAYTPGGIEPVENGTVGFVTEDAASDFDFITVENISYEPEITIHSPRESPNYDYNETVWFNVSMDKTINDCSYKIDDGAINEMNMLNKTYAYDSSTFGTYGERTVVYTCNDRMNNTVNKTRTFQVGNTPAGTFLTNGTETLQFSFNLGDFTNTKLNDSLNAITLNQSTKGTFESQVFDSGISSEGHTAVWEKMYWNLQDFGELPDYGESDKFGNMTNNILLVHLNGESGGISDYSGNSNDGTVYGGVNYGLPSARDSLNTAIELDGSSGYVDFGSVGVSGDQERTISGWVKTQDTGQSDWTNVFGFAGGSSSVKFFDIEVDDRSYCGDGGYVIHLHGDQWCILNDWDTDWYHIAATYDGNRIKAYLNGKLQVNESYSSDLSTVDNFHIGKREDNDNYFDGMVDEVAAWNRSLNAEEIKGLYHRTALNYNFSVRSCGTEDCYNASYQFIDKEEGTLDLDNNRYIQFLYNTSSDELDYSEELYNVTIEYSEDTVPNIFYDDFKTTDKISDFNNVNSYVTEDGGAQLASECLDYPVEPGCWEYRKKIELTEIQGENHLNYTFYADFDGKSLGNKLQDNCEDLRVTFVNSTGHEEPVHYWPEGGYCNSSESKLWIKSPYLASGETHTFYMYYGNPDASTGEYEEGGEVFDFFDDFSGGSLNTTKWDEISTTYHFPAGEDTIEYWDQPVAASINEFTNGTLRWRMLVTDEDGSFESSVGMRERDADSNPKGYYFMTDTMNSDYMGIIRDEMAETLVSFDELSPQETWLRGEGILDGSSLSFWTDFHQDTITVDDSTYRDAGKIQLWSNAPDSRRATLDWVFFLNRAVDSHSTPQVGEEESYYEDTGQFTSTLIEPGLIESWKYISPVHEIPRKTNITYGVKDKDNNILCRFRAGEPLRDYDISGCAYGEDSIRLFAELETGDEEETPLVNEWEVSWTYDVMNKLDEPDEIYHTRYKDFYMNGSVYTDEYCNISAYAQYMKTGVGEEIIEKNYTDFSVNEGEINVSVSDYLKLKSRATAGNLLDEGWRKRVRVNASLNETRTDYPVEIKITSSDVDEFGDHDFEDLRVTYYDETNNEEKVIPHWLQEKDDSVARLWAKVPELDTEDTGLYVYYDNPDAEDNSSADEVFLYYENFEDVDGWQAHGEGVSIRSEDNILKFRNPGGMHRAWAVPDPAVDFDNFVLEMRYRAARSQQEVGPMIRIPGSAAVGEIDGYKFNVRGRTEDDMGIAEMFGMNDDGGGYNWLQWVNLGWGVDDSWYHGRVIAEGDNMEWYPDYYDHDLTYLTESHSDYDSGNIGVWQFDNSEMEVDWLFIRPTESDSNVEVLGHEESYFAKGTYTSEEFETFGDATYDVISWSEDVPSGTDMDVFVRTSSDGTYWTDWYLQNNNEEASAPDDRFIQYRANFSTTNEELTPEFDDLLINYYESEQSFFDMQEESGALRVSAGDNPYECGIMNEGDYCYPEWGSVTAMERGKFNLRLLGEGESCSYTEPSNEKIIYVFAKTQIDNFNSDKDILAVGDEVTFSGEVYDNRGDAVGFGSLELLNEGELLKTTETDDTGAFTFTYQIPTDWDYGEHTMEAFFPRDYNQFYHPSSAETTITVSSKPQIENVSAVPDPSGNTENVQLSANVTDERGVDSVTAEITHPDGETVETIETTDDSGNGIYTADYSNTWDEGIYYFTIKAENIDGIRTESSSSFTVQIEGEAHAFTEQDKYKSYEEVLLDSEFRDIEIEELETWESDYNWSIAMSEHNYENLEQTNDTVRMSGWQTKTYNDDSGASSTGAGEWRTYYNETANVSGLDNMDLAYEYSLTGDGDADARARVLIDGSEVHFDENAGENVVEQINGYDVSGKDEVNVVFQYYSETVDWAWFTYESTAKIHWAEHQYSDFAGNGYLITEQREMDSDAEPNLRNLSYELNNNTIKLEVIGSPGTASEERQTQELTGKESYNLSWVNAHDKFKVNVLFEGDDPENVPVMDAMSLKYMAVLDQEEINSGFYNTGDTPVSGYRYALVQKWNEDTLEWEDIYPYVLYDKEGEGDKKTISPDGFLDIESDWTWFTDDYEPGKYRARIALVDNSSTPGSEEAVIVDSNGNRLEAFSNFTIKEARLFANNLTYPHLLEHGLIEYEVGEKIDWINLSLAARENTAFDVYTNLTLLDRHGIDYAGFGPDEEEKYYGDIDINKSKTRQWDNSSNGYPIGQDAATRTYQMEWDVAWDAVSGTYNETSVTWETNDDWSYPNESSNMELVDDRLILGYDKLITGYYTTESATPGAGWETYYEETFDVTNMDEMYMYYDYYLDGDSYDFWGGDESTEAEVRVVLNEEKEVHSDIVSGDNTKDRIWEDNVSVSDYDEVTVQFQYRAQAGEYADDATATIREAEHEYKSYKNEGYWETRIKGLSESMPNLAELSYELNDENISIDVIGSPGTADEEVFSLELLKDETGRDLFWDDWHEEYAVRVNLSTNDEFTTPEFDALTLESSFFVNVNKYLKVHNIPSTFNTTELDRLYLEESTPVSFSLRNLWTRDNITNVSVTINCPDLSGLQCLCKGEADDSCTTSTVSPLTTRWFDFNLTADNTTPIGDYYINFTVNYTNPAGKFKSREQKEQRLLEIRERGLFEITRYDFDEEVIRGENASLSLYANNTNTTSDDTNAWLNYTIVPDGWNVTEGNLSVYASVIRAGEILWNNITFGVQTEKAELGEQTLIANSSADNALPDFAQVFIDVYGRTNISQFNLSDEEISRGESVEVTAQLNWDNSIPVKGEKIYFYDETEEEAIASAITNSSGYATINYKPGSDALLGEHTLNATYYGSEDIYSLSAGETTTLDVGVKPQIKDVRDEPDPVGYGMNATIDADIMDDKDIDTALVNITSPNGSTIMEEMQDITSPAQASWETQTDWENYAEKEFVEILDGEIFLSGNEIKTKTYNVTDTNNAGNDVWETYKETEVDVRQMNEVDINYSYEIQNNDGGAEVRMMVSEDGGTPTEYCRDGTDGQGECGTTLDVSDTDNLVVDFQYYSGYGGFWGDDGEATIYWAMWEYVHLENEGYLLTGQKTTANPAQPDLTNLSYELNEGEVELEIIGSPGTGDEEAKTQQLTGDNFYELDWTDTHEDFRVDINFMMENDSIYSPVVDSINLESATNNYQYIFNDTWFNGTYDYYVWANDTSGSTVQSSKKQFELRQEGELGFYTNQSEYEQFSNVSIEQDFSWWDPKWEYKMPVTLSTSIATGENYQMFLELNQSNVGSNFDWSRGCEDIRFVNSNETGLLDYWIDTCNTTSMEAEIWVEVNENIASEKTIFMYYGNPEAESISSANDTFLLYGDFSGNSLPGGWTWKDVNSNGGVNVENDKVNLTSSEAADVWQNDYEATLAWQNKTVEGDFVAIARILSQDPINSWAKSGIMVQNNNEPATQDGKIMNVVTPDNDAGILWQTDNSYVAPDTSTMSNPFTLPTYLKLEKVGDQVTGYTSSDGENWQEIGSETPLGIQSEQYISLLHSTHDTSSTEGDAVFDLFYVKRHASEKPTAEFGEEEKVDMSVVKPEMRGHIVMEVQKETSSGWNTIDTHVKELSTDQFTYSQDNFINLTEIWNPNPWNTADNTDGLYRIYSYMVSPYGDKLSTTSGFVEGSDNFTILPPPVDVKLNEIRLYEVNESTREAGGDFLGSGLNMTHDLFVNYSYRAEIETEVQPDSYSWNLSNIVVNHTGLNESWPMDENADIWFRIEGENNLYEARFENGSVHWNTSAYDSLVPEDTTVTFYYAFNTTPDNTTGRYDVLFNLNDPRFSLYDKSTYDVVVEEAEPPSLYNETYNLTEREVIRSFNTTKIYARWTQDIAEAEIVYNTILEITDRETIDLPDSNPYNWTNYTIEPGSSWFLGEHRAKIEAENSAGARNDTLEYLYYTLYGLAYIEELSLNTTTPGINESIEINCTVYDDTNSSAIKGYNASLYSYSESSSVNELIYNGTTDSQGMISYNYTPSTFGSFEITCVIPEEGYYKTDDRYVETEEIFVLEFVPPWYDHVDGLGRVFKTEQFNTSSYWEDNAELMYGFLETNLSGMAENVTNTTLSDNSSWTDYSYLVNESVTPGVYSWRHHAQDTSYNINSTPLQDFEAWGLAEIDEMQQEPLSMYPGNWTTSSCHVRDIHSFANLSNYNVSFYKDEEYLGSNITNANGWAGYSFNISEEGSYNIVCNITDKPSIYYEASANNEMQSSVNVNLNDIEPPYLIEGGINDTELMRYESLLVYGQWNEEINYSKTIYNMTDGMTGSFIEPPYELNWTNTTLHINDSWDVGTRAVRLWANDTAGNINDSVPYLQFNVTGRSRIDWIEPNGTVNRRVYNLTCNVTDNDTMEGIQDYSVRFFGPNGYLDTVQTDNEGVARYEYDFSGLDYGDHGFMCDLPGEEFYTEIKESDSKTLTLEEADAFLNIWDDSDFKQVFQYENVTFYSNFTDSEGEVIEGSCNMSIENETTGLNMTFNNETKLYEQNYSFTEKGVYEWNATCDSPASDPLKEIDTVNISDGLAPEITLLAPEDGAKLDYNKTTMFTYNVTDQSGVQNCSLLINDTVNQTDNDIAESTEQNFTVEDMKLGYYNWTIKCTDTSPQSNTGQALARDLVISGSYLEMAWVNKPAEVFRGERHNFTVNLTNTGIIDANETNVTLQIPSGWDFGADSSSLYSVNVSVDETVQLSWTTEVLESASFGNQTINSTSELSVTGREDNVSAVAEVLAIDLSVDEIINPENNSCTYNNLNVSTNISNLDDVSKDNVTVNLFLNETIIESQELDFSLYETKKVNFNTHLLQNESRYNVTVFVDEPSDPNMNNNKKTHFLDKYFRHIKSSYAMKSSSDDSYRIQRTIENKKDCAIDSSYLAFLQDEFDLSSASFLEISLLLVDGGESYLWQDNIPSFGISELVYNVTGSGSYNVRELYKTGIAADEVE